MEETEILMLYPSWIAQALNFADAIGGTATFTDKDGQPQLVEGSSGFMVREIKVTVRRNSEIVAQTIQTLKDVYKIDMDEDALGKFITDQVFYFQAGNDYSHLFWIKESQMKLIRIGGSVAVPRPIAVTVAPPSASNTKGADLVVSVPVLANELAGSIAQTINTADNLLESVVQMAHKLKKQSTGSKKKTKQKHEKGQSHGNLKSKRGNKPNPNQRKSAAKKHGNKKKKK